MKPNQISLVIFFFLPLLILGQSRWIRTYLENSDVVMSDMALAYDGGYLICGSEYTNLSRYNWLIKTDINGEVLWEKWIGDGVTSIYLEQMFQNALGEIFLAGEVTASDGTYDPIIMKLNPCGEKEWCRILSFSDNSNYTFDICGSDTGGCTLAFLYRGDPPGSENLCLINLNANGETNWIKCDLGSAPYVYLEQEYELIQTNDNGYLITGTCSYTGPPGNWPYLHAYLIKTDCYGSTEWETIVEKDSVWCRAEAFSTTLSPDGQYYYSSIKRYRLLQDHYGLIPGLVQTDLSGNVIGIFEYSTPALNGVFYESRFIDDTTLAAIGRWGEDYHDKIALISTDGEMKLERTYLDVDYNDIGRLRITPDMKLLVCSQEMGVDMKWDIFLFKFNGRLIDDTLYLQPFKYDTLCNNTILNDTVFIDDCDLILDIDDEQGAERPSQDILQAWPNPCRNSISFSFDKYSETERIDFYNVYGQILYSREIGINPRQVDIDMGAFPPGIIIAVFKNSNVVLSTLKIIKL